MLNPWLSLSLQAARLGWETQSLVVDQMMRLAGVGNTDRESAGDFEHNTMAVPVRNKEAPQSPTAPVVKVAAPANSSPHPQVVQQVKKNQKKHRRVKKQRRSH
jgi:hypothetical protein